MKGIILAGGTGSRLAPMTIGLNKHLLPVYDKPMIYYPLSTLMLADIRDILLISRPEDLPLYKNLLGDGSQWNINLSYAEQSEPRGIAEAFVIGRDFINGDRSALILGDNIFFGHGFAHQLRHAANSDAGATVFGVWVPDPARFGVVTFMPGTNQVADIQEKPANPKSHHAVPGLYFYDADVCDIAASLKPSARGELEITAVNKVYLDQGRLHAIQLERGFSWYDAGVPDALLDAANFVGAISRRQGLKISCPEEIAWRKKWISDAEFQSLIARMESSDYGKYLAQIFSFRDL